MKKTNRPNPTPMPPPKEYNNNGDRIKELGKKLVGYHNGIITAKQDTNGEFMVLISSSYTEQPIAFPLVWYLGLLTEFRGIYQSLGMAYNPGTGAQCMEIVIHYSVSADSPFLSKIEEAIKETINHYNKKNESN